MATYRQDRALLMAAVGGLYEPAANPALWPEAVRSIATLFNARGAQVSVLNPREASLSFTVVHGFEYDLDIIDRYAELTVTDPMSVAGMRLPGKAMRCGQVGSRSEIRACPMYCELLHKVGIEYRMGVAVGDVNTQMSGLGISRGPDQADFDDDDVDLLSDIAPHFRRAMDLYACLSLQRSGEDFVLAALERLSIGVAIVDAMGSVMFLNTAGRVIVDDQGGLVVRNGHLLAERSQDTEHLARIVRQMATPAEAAVRAEFMAFQRPGGREPLSATVSPLHRHDSLPVPDVHARRLAMVVFTDPERQLEVPEELLQRLYGLTAAEAGLLAALVAGYSLDEAAPALGIVKETARKRLRIIFQKTGTNRQAELVRHVLANPVWITEQAKRPARIEMTS